MAISVPAKYGGAVVVLLVPTAVIVNNAVLSL
jgi:hypothetical protein